MALTRAGTALLAAAARCFSQRLDRTKPLWELWLIEGLPEGRFALVTKTHHCMIDGVSGVDISTVEGRLRISLLCGVGWMTSITAWHTSIAYSGSVRVKLSGEYWKVQSVAG